MSQEHDLLAALKQRPITPLIALRDLGIYRLAARVYDLRALGHNIITIERDVKTVRGKATVAEYVLLRGKKK